MSTKLSNLSISVLYHGNCYDGFTSAFYARDFLKNLSYIDSYHECHYGNPLPEIPDGSLVYFLDFSADRATLSKLAEKNYVVVLDHHATAQENLRGLPEALGVEKDLANARSGLTGLYSLFDMNRSGAMISANYFGDNKKTTLAEYIQDRDLWRFKLLWSKEVHSAISTMDYSFEVYEKLMNKMENVDYLRTLAASGEAVLAKDKKQVKMMCKNVEIIFFEDIKMGLINCTSHWSEVGNYVVENMGVPVCLAYHIDSDGNVKCSLRSDGTYDVAKLAERMGGGGHPSAAGYTVKTTEVRGIIGDEILPYIGK